jgi:single-stranded DNA-specific DHH superfamily exonuclease
MKPKHLDEMKKEGVDLVITVDNGITSLAEAEYAKEL